MSAPGIFRKLDADQSSPKINQLIQETMQSLGISRTFTCLVSPEIKAPAVFGFLKSTLLLPVGELKRMNDFEIRLLLLHELAHIKRRDPMANWITLLIQILHWFNPLAWMALNQFRLEREALCDAMVLNAISPRNHSDYGDLLIRFASSFSRTPITVGTVPIFSNQKQIKRRITMIAHHRPLTKKTIFLAALLLIPVISFTFTDQQKTESDALEIPGAVKLTEPTIVDSGLDSVFPENPEITDNAVLPGNTRKVNMNGVLKLARRNQSVFLPTERSELSRLESVRGGIRSDLILLQSQFKVLKKLEPREQRQAVRASYSDELLQQLELTEAETEQMIELLNSSFGPKHPEIQAANKSLETVQEQINRRMEGILKGIQFQVDTYKAQIEALDEAIEKKNT
ncbi:MAG TPA: hypothetical protein EYQ50_29785 [Verrucomicrobiales bacterium]|nr:hypothetical protein [Verrucomicrobiales bacterium]